MAMCLQKGMLWPEPLVVDCLVLLYNANVDCSSDRATNGGRVVTIRVRTASVVALLLLVTVFAGHSAGGETKPQETRPEARPSRRTPDELMRFYEIAHRTKNLQMYKETLHGLFRLEMDSENTRKQNLTPEEAWVGKAGAVNGTRRMFEDLKAVDIQLVPITEWEPCTEVRVLPSGERLSLDGLRITMDPLIYYYLYGRAGANGPLSGSYSWFHITVVRDPDSPNSWVILRIKDEVETH